MNSAHCPNCDGKIVLSPHVRVEQKLVCPHCEAELEVISIDPLEFDWAYDWSWDDDKDYDDDEDW